MNYKSPPNMKRSIPFVAIAALFAVVSAFTGKTQIQQWNVDHPYTGSPGVYFLTSDQVKNIYCPGVNNQECAYLVGNAGVIIKRP